MERCLASTMSVIQVDGKRMFGKKMTPEIQTRMLSRYFTVNMITSTDSLIIQRLLTCVRIRLYYDLRRDATA